MWEAYRAHMSSTEVLGRPSSIRTDHATLLRRERSERTRTLAFWASFDANPGSRQRWVDSCAAYWRTPGAAHGASLLQTTTP
jgi:hypothetical protein